MRHGDCIAKVRFAPVRAFADAVERRVVDLMSDPDAYHHALVAELKQRPFEFDLQVQLCTNLEQMPVQDVTVEWLERSRHSSPWPRYVYRRRTFPVLTTSKKWTRCPLPPGGSRRAYATRRDHAEMRRSADARRSHAIGSTVRSGGSREACARCSASDKPSNPEVHLSWLSARAHGRTR